MNNYTIAKDDYDEYCGAIFTAIGDCQDEIRKLYNSLDYENISELTYYGLRIDVLERLHRIMGNSLEHMRDCFDKMKEVRDNG